jgi:hypothetical protein
VCAAIVTQLDTQSRPEAVMLAPCARLRRLLVTVVVACEGLRTIM